MNPDPRYWKLTITSYVRVLALECLAGKGWVRQCDLRAYMIQNISPEDACRYREHVIKVSKLKRTARTLSEKVALGQQRIMQVVEASLRRSKSVRFQNGKWLL